MKDKQCEECKIFFEALFINNMCADCYANLFFSEEEEDDFCISSEIAQIGETNLDTMYLKSNKGFFRIPRVYSLDANKITTLEEVKIILDGMDLHISEDYRNFNKIRHLLKEEE